MLALGPLSFICDERAELCIDIIEADDDLELFRLIGANEENEAAAYPALLELARGMSTGLLLCPSCDPLKVGKRCLDLLRAQQ
jgi:hypothetical protein